MECRHRTQSLTFLQAEWIPMFADCTSASVSLSQVVCGHPRDLRQSFGGRSDAVTARWWFSLKSERAGWPKKWSLLVLMILETGAQLVVSLTEVLITCLVYGIQRIFRRDHVSKASISLGHKFTTLSVHLCLQHLPWCSASLRFVSDRWYLFSHGSQNSAIQHLRPASLRLCCRDLGCIMAITLTKMFDVLDGLFLDAGHSVDWDICNECWSHIAIRNHLCQTFSVTPVLLCWHMTRPLPCAAS